MSPVVRPQASPRLRRPPLSLSTERPSSHLPGVVPQKCSSSGSATKRAARVTSVRITVKPKPWGW